MAEIKEGSLGDLYRSGKGTTPSGGLGTDPSLNVRLPNGGVVHGDLGDTATSPTPDPTDKNARIGDYVVGRGGLPVVVPNSMTDLNRKYTAVYGANERGKLTATDYVNAVISAGAAALGAPTKTDNMGNLAMSSSAGQVMNKTLPTRIFWAGYNFADSLQSASLKYTQDWLNQDVRYVRAFDVVTDENGNMKAIINPSAAVGAGSGSGSMIGDLTDTSKTAVSLNGNGGLSINVSRAFAESDAYADVVKEIQKSLPSKLTEEEANKVYEEDTGRTLMNIVNDLVSRQENLFYYNAMSVESFKNIAPEASSEALQDACYTQLVGAFDSEEMKDAEITVYDEDNNKTSKNAYEYIESIKNMDKKARDDYMMSLGNRIQSNDISDDEKAILLAQSNALYMASGADDSEFSGMLSNNWFDATLNATGPIGDIVSGVLGLDRYETFTTSEAQSAVLAAVTGGARMAITAGAQAGLEKTVASGVSKLSPALSNILSGGAAETVGQLVAKPVARYTVSATADLAYETARAGLYAATGNDFDFWDELKTDLAIDFFMTAGPGAFVEVANAPKVEYGVKVENTKTGETSYQRWKDIKKNSDYKIVTDELGQRDVKLITVSHETITKERNELYNKLTDSKISLAVQRLFSDKNAAFQKLAAQVRAVTGDNFLARKVIRAGHDIQQLTKDFIVKFKSDAEVAKHFEEFNKVLNEVAPKVKNFTEADANYMNAVANKHRFTKKNEGKKNFEEIKKKISEKYDSHINGVSKERAAQLDKLMETMRVIYADAYDFLAKEGLLSEADLKKMREMPEYKDGMYFAVWGKGKEGFDLGAEISQTRNVEKRVKDEKEFVDVENLNNPLLTFTTLIGGVARNAADNWRKNIVKEAAETIGVDMRVISDSGGSLLKYDKLKSDSAEFKEIFDKIVEDVNKEIPTQEEWQANNNANILRSGAFKNAKKLESLRQEGTNLRDELRKTRDRGRRAKTLEEAIEYDTKAMELEGAISANKAEQDKVINDFKRNAITLFKRMRDNNKSNVLDLDIESFANVQMASMVKKALKSNNYVGELQAILNTGVELANPYIPRDVYISQRASAAAIKFRKEIHERLKKEAKKNKTALDKANDLADRITDAVVEKALGVRKKKDVSLSSYGNDRKVRYYQNGKLESFTLYGKGAKELAEVFREPEATLPKNVGEAVARKAFWVGSKIAAIKRYTTTTADIVRVLPNLFRDLSRGTVTTGGKVLLDPKTKMREVMEEVAANNKYTDAEIKKMQNGLAMAEQRISESTLTKSMEAPKKNRVKELAKAAAEPTDGNAFTKMVWNFKKKTLIEKLATLQDAAETFTRKRAMDVGYALELQKCAAEGLSADESIARAMEAAYFYGVEATTNFSRRGTLIEKISKQVPYLTAKFASFESLKLAYLDDPIAVTRSFEILVGAYVPMLAITLSNDESRKKYYMLSEYERANNIIISLSNDAIIKIPLDDNLAAFLSPYRRMVESLNGVDKEAFYLIFADSLTALSPFDLSGFSEGDKVNVRRGFEKFGAEFIPTWALPFVENAIGRNLYFGNDIKIDSDYTGRYSGNYDPTAGELTTKGKNSKVLALIADATGIPQWKLQTFYNTYGGNDGQYMLNVIDKLAGATEEQQGGKNFMDAIFQPLVGAKADDAASQFYNGIDKLNEDKKALQKKLKAIEQDIEVATGDKKAQLIEKRQQMIRDYGNSVSDFCYQYLSAYEITGGLPKEYANRIWYLYDIYEDDENSKMYTEGSQEAYYNGKIRNVDSEKANALAAASGFDRYVAPSVNDYQSSYGKRAFEKSIYGQGSKAMAKIATLLEDKSDYANSFTKLRNDMYDKRTRAYAVKDYDLADKITYEYDYLVLMSIYPILEEVGLEDALNSDAVIDYLQQWVLVPSEEQKDSKGRYVPNLGENSQKRKAFTKQFIKKVYGVK